MCDFCKNVKTGDDYEPLIRLEVDLGMIGKPELSISLAPDSLLCADVLFPDYSHDIQESVEIKYCPMCGERL